MLLRTKFWRFFTYNFILISLSIALYLCGCRNEQKNEPIDEPWVTEFKKELAQVDEQFFSSKYIQEKDDPFYLDQHQLLPNSFSFVDLVVQNGQPLPGRTVLMSDDLKQDLESVIEDYKLSWDNAITKQFDRLQMIFSLVAVLPAHSANLLMISPKRTYDLEIVAWLTRLKKLIEDGSIFKIRSQRLHLAPEVKDEVLVLVNQICKKTLVLVAESIIGGQVPQEKIYRLNALRDQIRLLNVNAAESVAMPLSIDKEPFIDSPFKTMDELSKGYHEIFSFLSKVIELDQLNQSFVTLHLKQKPSMKNIPSVSKSQEKNEKSEELRRKIVFFALELQTKSPEINRLHLLEKTLLQALVFSTDKQYKLSASLINSKSN